jgi:hypothetical protein
MKKRICENKSNDPIGWIQTIIYATKKCTTEYIIIYTRLPDYSRKREGNRNMQSTDEYYGNNSVEQTCITI